MTVDLTVAIPTFNGESRLPKLLERLGTQINTEHLNWEIIIVDNNSTDNTAKVVQEYQKTWQKPYPLKYCLEAKQGAAFARIRAIKEAQGVWVGFLDDDVLPAPDWVAAAHSFSLLHPQMGAYGGQIHAEFEVKPPDNIKRLQSFLAIRERGETAHLYNPDQLVLPPSAALVVRKQAWCETVPARPILTGRTQATILSGEDFEALLYMNKAGWEIWYNPAMHTYHQIPPQRLEKDNLLSLIRGSTLCICYLRMIKPKLWQKPIIFFKIMLGSLRRLILHLIKYRGQVQTDLIAACEMEFHLSSFASPFYCLKTLTFNNKKT